MPENFGSQRKEFDMEFKTTILTLDTPTKNGTIYTTDVVEAAIKKLDGPVFGTILDGSSPTIFNNVDRISHYVTDIHIDDNEVKGTVHVLDTPVGRAVREFRDAQYGGFRITSMCMLDPDAAGIKITDMDITSVDYTVNPA